MVHQTIKIDGHSLESAVLLAAIENDAFCKGIFGRATCFFNQLANGRNASIHLVHTWTEDCTLDFHHIGVAVEHGIYEDGVTICHLERCTLKFVKIIYGIAAAALAHQAHSFGEGIARETTRIIDEGAQTLGALHFVIHRTLHLSRDIDQTFVGVNGDNISRGQTHVASQVAAENIIINVHLGDKRSVSIHLYITQRSDVVDTASHIKGMKYGSKCRQVVSTRHNDLAHHIDCNGTGLAHRQSDIRTAITLA